MSNKKEPTRSEAMLAMCHECCGHYQDGKVDCENPRCPLYKWMPYRKQEPILAWTEYNPKAKGKVLKAETKREISEEKKKELAERMKKARKARKKNT